MYWRCILLSALARNPPTRQAREAKSLRRTELDAGSAFRQAESATRAPARDVQDLTDIRLLAVLRLHAQIAVHLVGNCSAMSLEPALRSRG